MDWPPSSPLFLKPGGGGRRIRTGVFSFSQWPRVGSWCGGPRPGLRRETVCTADPTVCRAPLQAGLCPGRLTPGFLGAARCLLQAVAAFTRRPEAASLRLMPSVCHATLGPLLAPSSLHPNEKLSFAPQKLPSYTDYTCALRVINCAAPTARAVAFCHSFYHTLCSRDTALCCPWAPFCTGASP